MAEICLCKRDYTTYQTILYYGGKGYLFDTSYQFVDVITNILPDSTWQSVDVISVLQSKGNVEVAVLAQGTFTKFDVNMTAVDALTALDAYPARNLLVLARSLRVENQAVKQYLAVFPQNSLNPEVVRGYCTVKK